MENSPENLLLVYLVEFCKKNGYEIVIPSTDGGEVDYINLNFKTKQMFAGDMGMDEIID